VRVRIDFTVEFAREDAGSLVEFLNCETYQNMKGNLTQDCWEYLINYLEQGGIRVELIREA
jgi:hypothetical protein